MYVRRFTMLFGCLSLLTFVTLAVAEDPAAPAAAEAEEAAAPATAEQIAEWITQLNHDGFNIREAAQTKLAAAGTAAIDALGQAALGESQEAATRAVEILKQHFHGEDDSLKQAAETALSKISKSDNPIAARRAEAALEPPAKPESTPAQQPATAVPFGRGGIRIGGGGIRLGGGGEIRIEAHTVIGGGKGKSVSVKNVDGNLEINAEEEGRKVKIEESAAGKIKMAVTEKVDGKEETKSYEAESADDLKKVHPDAHKIYEQYKQGGGIGRIEFNAVPLEGGIRIAPALPDGIPAEHAKRIEEAQKRLEETRKRLEAELPKLKPEGDKTSSAAEQLDAAIKQLAETRAQLEKSAAEGSAESIKQAIEGLEAAKKQLEEAKAKLAE